MKNKTNKCVVVFALVAASSFAYAEEKKEAVVAPPVVNPYAVKVMKRSADFLAAAPQFSVNAEIWKELEDANGNFQEYTKEVAVKLKRPGSLRIDVSRNTPTRSFYFNGKELTVQDHVAGFYGTAAVEGSIDQLITKVESKFDITFPLEDLLVSKPFGGGAKKAKSGQYLGKDRVLGVSCDHVAFQSELINWQAWIATGPQPLVRKVVIIFKGEKGAPRFTALLSNWDVTTPLSDHNFSFDQAPEFTEIDIISTADKPASTTEEKK